MSDWRPADRHPDIRRPSLEPGLIEHLDALAAIGAPPDDQPGINPNMRRFELELQDVAARLVAVRFDVLDRGVELRIRDHCAAVFERDELRRWLERPNGDLDRGGVAWTATADGVVLTIRAAFISTRLTRRARSTLRALIWSGEPLQPTNPTIRTGGHLMSIQPWFETTHPRGVPSPTTCPSRANPDQEPVVSWTAPPWAERSTPDEDCVVHRRRIGEVRPAFGEESLRVEVVQRDELCSAAGSTRVSRTQARISVSGELLTRQEAQDLARLLSTASQVIQ